MYMEGIGLKVFQNEYERRVSNFTNLFQKEKKRFNLFSNLRTVIFIVGVLGSVYLFFIGNTRNGNILLLITFLIFIVLIKYHQKIKYQIERLSSLIKINQDSLARLDGGWTEFLNEGSEFIDTTHPYSTDLDLFGKASLYQWINVTNTYFGQQFLKDSLLKPEKDIKSINQRQQAVAELAQKLDWRQELQSEGMISQGKVFNPLGLLKWAESSATILNNSWMRVVFRVFPIMMGISIILALTVPTITTALPATLFIINLLIIGIGYQRVKSIFNKACGNKNVIKQYHGLLKKIEDEQFAVSLIKELKTDLFNKNGCFASQQIEKLLKIIDLTDLRYNGLFHFVINGMFLWDYQCVLALERWKENNGQSLRKWLQLIGQLEALSSLAIISYDHPDWTFPEFSKSANMLSAKEIGHPLILNEQRVCNNVSLQGSGSILVITGSNMSGKSTLLRTVGINLVLAYTGAPVCASRFRCSLLQIYSSMRVNDNLEKSISSFYAELLRIKLIVEASRRKEQIIFLLDEIFKGTNTRDRQIGAKTVLRNLSTRGAMGLVSTHDLELGQLQNEPDLNVKNYHFTEKYQDNQIHFDYRLQPGISQTSNAIYLMKMVGIDID